MEQEPLAVPSFEGLAQRALSCAQEWRSYASKTDNPRLRRSAYKLATLFTLQFGELTGMARESPAQPLTYNPEMMDCPRCHNPKSPTGTVCRKCYREAKIGRRTATKLRAWAAANPIPEN